MRGKELEDLKKPSGLRRQCQFVPVRFALRSPGFLSTMVDLIESEVSFDSSSDKESDRS